MGVDARKMSWQAVDSETVVWENNAAYRSAIGRLIAAREARLYATVDAFLARGFLTQQEAETVRPLLTINIFDGRVPARPPLPSIHPRDPRTTVVKAIE